MKGKSNRSPKSKRTKRSRRTKPFFAKEGLDTLSDNQAFFKAGRDKKKAEIHHGQTSHALNRLLGAEAFTYGNHVFFGQGKYQPTSNSGQELLRHELTHVQQQKGKPPVIQRRALNSAEEKAAIAFAKANYDERSRRILQIITGAGIDGVFGPLSARSVSNFQTANGIADHGKVEEATLNKMISDRVTKGRQEHAIQLVLDFYNISLGDVLSVRFDPSAIRIASAFPFIMVPADTTFTTGNQRLIRVSATAFGSAKQLKDVILAEKSRPAPAVAPVSTMPTRLNATKKSKAIAFMKTNYKDPRAIHILQGLIGSPLTGVIGEDLVQRIAEVQATNSLGSIDGKVGKNTLKHFFLQLRTAGENDAAIRLITEFYNFKDKDNLLQLFFEPSVSGNADTDFRPNEPVRIRIGLTGISQAFERVVHTIAHEFEHARRLKQGIVSAHTHEFLGESIEILSHGMSEEILETTAPGTPGHIFGFASDAQRAVSNWNAMPLADRKKFWSKFVRVRKKVLKRINGGTPAQKILHATLKANYKAVVRPP